MHRWLHTHLETHMHTHQINLNFPTWDYLLSFGLTYSEYIIASFILR